MMCSRTCKYEWLNPNSKLFCIMKNLTECVNAKDTFASIFACPVHYQVHICTGGESCILTEDGTCCYTGNTFDGLVRTDAFGVDGVPDFCSNVLALGNSGPSAKSKPAPVTDIMDQDSFIASVHQGLMYAGRESAIHSENESLSSYMRELLAKIHAVMSYNCTIPKTANVTPCNVWVNSTTQVLRKLQGKDLIPNITSKPEVKGIVLQTLLSLKPPKQTWWAKKSFITKQWHQ